MNRFAANVAGSQRGFSLIEILVVMALIGVIVALVANSIAGGGLKAKVGAAKIGANALANKIEVYALDNGSPPERIEDLVTKPGSADNWAGPYAKQAELLDPWKQAFLYRRPGTEGRDYDVYSLGPDGKEGGEELKAADIYNEN